MNKQIKDLAKQAGGLFEGIEYGTAFYTQEQFELFAKLLVRQCTDLLDATAIELRNQEITIAPKQDKSTEWMKGREEAVRLHSPYILLSLSKNLREKFGID